MEVALYRTKYEECRKYYGSNTETFMPNSVDDETQLCAGAGQLLKDACHASILRRARAGDASGC